MMTGNPNTDAGADADADADGQRSDRRALILYGSETGNSQDAAGDLGRMAERLHFLTRVCEMDLVEINELSQYTVVIFAISTTGQGEFPRNSRKFWKSLLRKRLQPGCLDHVSFTTFGLGDSSYPRFNWSARKLHKRLEQLGAKEVYPRGEADEQHPEGIDGTFLSWSADFRKQLLSRYPLPAGLTPIPPETFLPPKFKLVIIEEGETMRLAHDYRYSLMRDADDFDFDPILIDEAEDVEVDINPKRDSTQHPAFSALPASLASPDMEMRPELVWTEPEEPGPSVVCEQLKEGLPNATVPIETRLPSTQRLPIKDAFSMKLQSNKRVTPEKHWQDVRELTFIVSGSLELLPGDTVTIYPKNFPADVDALINLMDWQSVADKPLKFEPEAPNYYNDDYLLTLLPRSGFFPLEKSTLRELLTHNLDITAIPNRHFFEVIANHTDDPMHKERLLEFASPFYTDEFYDYTSRPRRSILEVLQDFPTVKLPWKWACSIFPLIRGRDYSISSGGVLGRYRNKRLQKIQILVAIVKYQTLLKKIRQGLCSRYLASLPPKVVITGTFVGSGENTFYKIPRDDKSVDTISVCAGTGLAPIRALLWERSATAGSPRQFDVTAGQNILIYGGRNQEADFFYREEWDYRQLKTEVLTAFSRDQREKIYVQDVIRKNGEKLRSVMKNGNCIIYVCGSSGNMPKGVKEAFLDILSEGPGNSRKRAELFLALLEKDGRYIQETW